MPKRRAGPAFDFVYNDGLSLLSRENKTDDDLRMLRKMAIAGEKKQLLIEGLVRKEVCARGASNFSENSISV